MLYKVACHSASPSECCYSGGRQCPGDVMLVMSRSWLSKEKSDRKDGLNALFVHKAITFGSDGRSFLDQFEPPRRVTYFMEVSSDIATQDFEVNTFPKYKFNFVSVHQVLIIFRCVVDRSIAE